MLAHPREHLRWVYVVTRRFAASVRRGSVMGTPTLTARTQRAGVLGHTPYSTETPLARRDPPSCLALATLRQAWCQGQRSPRQAGRSERGFPSRTGLFRSGQGQGRSAAGPGSGPCSASKVRLTAAKASSARSSTAVSWVAMTLVRSSAPPGGTAGWIATFTYTPAS